MSGGPVFRGAVHQQPYLARGAREVDAVISVDARVSPEETVTAAEVLILDRSSSMGDPVQKIDKAVEAGAAAIDEMRDGVLFAVVAGSSVAELVWPREPRLVPADERSRAEAKRALRALRPSGGTAIGHWLRLARDLLGAHPGAVHHAILLTDGRNEHETPAQLAASVRACEGVFTCDCRGVGTGWLVEELRTVASGLLGTVDIVAEPDELAEDFRSMMAASMRKTVPEVQLRLWTPTGAVVRFVRQVSPTIEDLSARRRGVDSHIGEYPAGSWGTESRDYHVCVDLEPGHVGDEKLAARVTFVRPHAGGDPVPLQQSFRHLDLDGSPVEFEHVRVRAVWSDDLARVSVINERVADVTGRAELSQRVRDGLDAHRRGDLEVAADQLGQARQLAHKSQDAQLLPHLDRLYDPETGTIRLERLGRVEAMSLDIDSTSTTPLPRS